MQKLQDILTSADVPGRNEQPSTSTSWCLRQSAAQDELQKEAAITSTVCCPATVFQRGTAATAHLLPLFAAETACRRSGSVWIVTYIYTPNSHYHNRESCIEGVYKPIEPTLCCAKEDGRYTLVKQGRCLNFFVKWLKLCLFFFLPRVNVVVGMSVWQKMVATLPSVFPKVVVATDVAYHHDVNVYE